MPKARELTNDEVEELLSLSPNDIDAKLLRSYFACFHGQKAPRFNTFDTFTLPAKKWFNDTAIKTTIGRYICNIMMFPDSYLKKFGYQNTPLKKGAVEDIEDNMADMILNDEMTTQEYIDYLDVGEWIGMGQAFYLVPTMNYDINVPIPEVIEKRDELFEKYSDGVKKGDPDAAKMIEKEVIKMAEDKIKEKGNEAYDFFAAGVGKFANNYKKTSIMAGAIENPYTHKLDILKSNYINGIDIKEFPKFTNLTIIGGYSRGVETMTSGYETKKINNAMQTLVLDDAGSDCGTKFYNTVMLGEKTAKLFINRYILDNSGNLVLLKPDNIKQYVGKEVKMRSPMFCRGDKICNKCAGDFFYKMNIKNAGLLTSTLSGTLMNLSMKKFHDSTVKFNVVDIEEYISKH